MQLPTFEKEYSLSENCLVIGLDEAGRGPLAGPVVAAAVCYKREDFAVPDELITEFELIRDSKKLSPKQRARAFTLVHEHFHIGVGIVNHETIDRVNILQATFLAMRSALSDLKKTLQTSDKEWHVLVDGSQKLPSYSGLQEAVVGGDSSVRSIAAASIVAKETRDRLLEELALQYPEYGFEKHKGYGTKEHMEALRKYGACAIHRKSFQPVALICDPEKINKQIARLVKKA